MEIPVENNCFKSSHPYFTDEDLQPQKERYRPQPDAHAGGPAPGPGLLAIELNCLFRKKLRPAFWGRIIYIFERLDDEKRMKA